MKYTDTQIGFQEFPDEISLLINISNCPFHCPGCHSPELWEDVGIELNCKELHKLISHNHGITLVGFMGGQPEKINSLAEYVKNIDSPLKVGWYWGGEIFPKEINPMNFDYIKLGPYIKKLGGLDNPNTNQRMYKYIPGFNDPREGDDWRDITYKFWKHGK
jgi:anaerobic ribonucleoside-triphosphate reductase activating protein